jgi:hypothetical protein
VLLPSGRPVAGLAFERVDTGQRWSWAVLPVLLKTQTSESDFAVTAFSPSPAKLDGSDCTCHDVPLKCSRIGPTVPVVVAPLGHNGNGYTFTR